MVLVRENTLRLLANEHTGCDVLSLRDRLASFFSALGRGGLQVVLSGVLLNRGTSLDRQL